VQVFELADELGVRSIDVLDACASVGLTGMAAGSELGEEEVKRVRFAFNQRETAEAMAQAAAAERPTSFAPALPPIPAATSVPAAPTRPRPPTVRRPVSQGMHPLIKRALWHLLLAQIVPCIGLYFLISSLVLAGKGRRQIAWSGGRYSGDTAGLVIQIVVWMEIVLTVVAVVVYAATAGGQAGV
jgi:hypothetical protein